MIVVTMKLVVLLFYLTLALSQNDEDEDPLKAALAALQDALSSPSGVRGKPFPSIPGPSPSDKVCILLYTIHIVKL